MRPKNSILNGAAWVAASRVTVRLLGLLSTIVLARLLVPEDFGLIAVAVGITGLIESLTRLGFNQALIHYKNATEEDYSTAWILNMLRGFGVAVVLLVVAYPASLVLEDHRYFSLISVLAIVPIVSGAENVKFIEFDKKLEFNIVFKVMVITKLFGVFTTISLAFLWRNYWVLIAGMIVTNTTRTLLTYVYAPRIVCLTIGSWKRLFRFSIWLLGAELLGASSNKLHPIIITSIFSPHLAGIVHVSREVTGVIQEFTAPLRRVLFPALSNLDVGSEEFCKAYRKSVEGMYMIVAPICLGLAVVAPTIIPLVFGEKWNGAIIYMQIIAIAMMIALPGRISESALMAAGKTRSFFFRNLIYLPISIAVIIVFSILFGENGLMVSLFFVIVFMQVLNVTLVATVTGFGIWDHAQMAKKYFIILAFMTILFSASMDEIHSLSLNDPFLLLATIVAALIFYLTYIGGCFLQWRLSGMPDTPELSLYLKWTSFSKNL